MYFKQTFKENHCYKFLTVGSELKSLFSHFGFYINSWTWRIFGYQFRFPLFLCTVRHFIIPSFSKLKKNIKFGLQYKKQISTSSYSYFRQMIHLTIGDCMCWNLWIMSGLYFVSFALLCLNFLMLNIS